MKKKIIALSIAFVLVAIAAIGTTLAYLTDNAGNVTNNFTVGNIKIDAVEYVNHTNGAGDDKDPEGTNEDPEVTEDPYKGYKMIDLATDDSASYNYENVLPGDNLYKKVVISNNATGSNPAIFAVTVKTDLPDEALAAGAAAEGGLGAIWSDNTALAANVPALTGKEVEYLGVVKTPAAGSETKDTYVYYYFMPVGKDQEINLSAVVPGDLDSADLTDYNNKTIVVSVAAIQAEGFSTPAEAIAALATEMAKANN